MSKMETDFAFELGDIVYLKTASHTLNMTPQGALIIGRIAEECTAGVQNHYVVQLDCDSVKVHELCLTKERPPFTMCDEQQLEALVRYHKRRNGIDD